MLHLNDRCFYSCLWITPDLRCQKRLWILCFPTTSIKIWRSGAFSPFSPLHLGEPLRKQKVVVCDLWLVDFDPSCVFLCFKVRCFVFENHRKFYLSSNIFLSSLHWNVASLDSKGEIVPNRASKSRENTAMEGWKRTANISRFADKHIGCYGNGLIDVVEKFEFGACSIWIVEDVGTSSFLFPTNLGRSKETLFTGYSEPVSSTKLTGPLSLFSFPWSRHWRIKIPRISAVSSSRKLNDIYFLFTLLKLVASFGTCKLHNWKDGRP